MRSDNDRDLGNNWSDSSTFAFNGSTFTTEKGSELLREIDQTGQGENIYSESTFCLHSTSR
jgi:hypothetical protein